MGGSREDACRDRIICYSPKTACGEDETPHAFTAPGEVPDEGIVQIGMEPDFKPFRRRVKYLRTGTVQIGPLINDLQFIRNKKQGWNRSCAISAPAVYR